MLCPKCQVETVKAGFYSKRRIQMYRCKDCGKRFGELPPKPLGDRRIPEETIMLILRCLTEGSSVRGTARLCDVQSRTVLNVLRAAGEKCEKLMGKKIRNVPVKDVQADEIWGFIFKKEKAVEEGDDPSWGDAYTFVAIERHTKLVLNFALGKRNQATTDAFIEGLRAGTSPQDFQITTDGFVPYVSSIDNTLSDRVDYAQLVKVYRATPEGERVGEHEGLAGYLPESHATAVAEAAREASYAAILFPATAQGKDLAPRVAAVTGMTSVPGRRFSASVKG